MSNLIAASRYCDSVFDGTHDTPKSVKQGKLLITSKHISGGTLDVSSAYMISEEDYASIQKRSAVSQWDILFSMIGSVGEIYLEKNGEVPYAIKNMGVFSCNNEYKAKWLYYYLRSPAAQSHIKRYLNGAVQKFLPLGALRDFPVIPFSDEKKNLVKVLEALDAKIACNNRINAELEAMAKTLYDYWFVQFDFPYDFAQGKPATNGKPYRTSGGKMTYNPTLKREIPAGWEVKSIADVGSFKNGINYDPSVGGNAKARIVNVRNVSATTVFIKENQLDILDLEQADIDKYLVTSDSILIARSGIPGATRMMSFCPPNTIYCGFIICLTVENPEDKLLLFFKMKQIEQSLLSQSSGSILKNVSQDTLKAICFAMPPDEMRTVIQSFNATVNPILEKISLCHQESGELTQLRDWLLPMLMNGQVSVA